MNRTLPAARARLCCLVLACFVALGGCSEGTHHGSCPDSPCPTELLCVAGVCVEAAPTPHDAGLDAPPFVAQPDSGPGAPCGSSAECQSDSRCVDGHCSTWGPGDSDPTCVRSIDPGPLHPQEQCTWTGSEPSIVAHTPIVANLRIATDPDSAPRPNVVFVSSVSTVYAETTPGGCGPPAVVHETTGVLRVIDGATCTELAASLGGPDSLVTTVAPAVGDLDGDGRPEVVAMAQGGGLLAFSYDATARAMLRRWRASLPDGTIDTFGSGDCFWDGVSLYDLDDDGLPEVLFNGGVWSSTGVRLDTVEGWRGTYRGATMTVADVDADGRPELVAAEGVWEWRDGAFHSEWTGSQRGHIAIADFGDFPGHAGDAPGRPEIVVVSGGSFRVLSIRGSLIATSSVLRGSVGGPPTIADYDGDGVPEVGAAFSTQYAVFDVRERRMLWSRPTQDESSRQTGSSVFDFNGDGRAEVVYGDECYVRVFDGPTGNVLFSQPRASSTWQENAVIADVDADGSAEIVVQMQGSCISTCDPVDPIFAGLTCEEGADCLSGTCDSGFCRCTRDDECGDGNACVAPLSGTRGTGNVCRSAHRDCAGGVRVYRDTHDRWASSRPIWNQHAYFVTNVESDGTVPAWSDTEENWSTPGLNNFRQNSQGDLGSDGGADLTVRDLAAICAGPDTRIEASVCNRGTAFLDSGVEIIFRQLGGDELCRLRTLTPVGPGECSSVFCTAPVRAEGVFEAVVDPDGRIGECIEENNMASGVADCLI